MDKGIAAIIGCLVFIALWAGLGLLIAWLIEWSWNMLIPALFHGPRIDYAMACALYFLLSLVIGLLRPSKS